MSQAARIETWARLLKVAGTLRTAVEGDLKAAGFPAIEWYDTLLALAPEGEAGMRPFALRERVALPQYTLSRLLDRMERAGLVSRRPCPEDGRGQIVTATDKGLELLDDMWPVYRAAILDRFGGTLSMAEVRSLNGCLARLSPEVAALGD